MKQYLSCLFLVIGGHFAFAQGCNCDHILTNLSTTDVNIFRAANFDYEPGDVFCVNSGDAIVAGLRFMDFKGTAEQPLTIINCGGQVKIRETPHAGINFIESEYIHLTGIGHDAYTYGFHIMESGAGQVGVSVTNYSSDIEIDHIEIEHTGFAGIMAKTDPRCNDPSSWRVNGFVLKNLNIHHNYIHDTHSEGIYVGYSGGYKVWSNVVCEGQYRYGHWLENVDIHHNILEDIGWDGIQMHLVRSNCKVRDNTITNWATSGEFFQDFAMNIGGGVYEVYNNLIRSTGNNEGKGLQVISAQSGSKFYNNVIINPKLHGIFVHARHQFENPNEGYYFMNNTVVNPERSGFFYDAEITLSNSPSLVGTRQNDIPLYFVNNAVISPGATYANATDWRSETESFFDFNTPDTRDAQLPTTYTNFMTRRVDTIGIVSASNDDYAPANSTSPLVNTGSDLSAFGVNFDIYNYARPFHGSFDRGAYEYQGTITGTNETQGKPSSVRVYPNPVSQGLVYIDVPGQETQLSIYQSNGQLTYQNTLPQGTSQLVLPKYPRGTYFLRFADGQHVWMERLVVGK